VRFAAVLSADWAAAPVAPPCDVAPVPVSGVPYYKCGATWYTAGYGSTGVVYMPNKGYCEAARTNDLYDLTKRPPWAGSSMSPCQPLGSSLGGPYWAFALDSLPGGFGVAFSMRETCEQIEGKLKRAGFGDKIKVSK